MGYRAGLRGSAVYRDLSMVCDLGLRVRIAGCL